MGAALFYHYEHTLVHDFLKYALGTGVLPCNSDSIKATHTRKDFVQGGRWNTRIAEDEVNTTRSENAVNLHWHG